MLDAVMLIICVILSSLLFNFLFYKLNVKFGLFETIQNKIDDLDEDRYKKLRVVSYIFVIVIYVIVTMRQKNIMIEGILFGLLFSGRDICFKDTFIENINK